MSCKMMTCDMFGQLQRTSNPVLCPNWPIWAIHPTLFQQNGLWNIISTLSSSLCAFGLAHSSPEIPPPHPKICMKSCSRVPGQFLLLPRAFLALARCAPESRSPERCRVKLDQFPLPYYGCHEVPFVVSVGCNLQSLSTLNCRCLTFSPSLTWPH